MRMVKSGQYAYKSYFVKSIYKSIDCLMDIQRAVDVLQESGD